MPEAEAKAKAEAKAGAEVEVEVTLNLTAEEALRLEEIITDRDAQEALNFVLEVLKPKLQAKGKRAIDQKKGMGMV